MTIMKPFMQTSELISALADGQLQGDEFAQALRTCQLDESALACWDAYHLIGDVLRSPAPSAFFTASQTELAFMARLNTRIAQEPGLQVLDGLQGVNSEGLRSSVLGTAASVAHHRGRAANEGNFGWKLVAGLASLAAVSAIAWNAAGLFSPSPSPQLAQASSAQVLVASPQGPIVRDAGLEELLAAHRQLGTASVLQEPSGFLRNAAFDLPQDARR